MRPAPGARVAVVGAGYLGHRIASRLRDAGCLVTTTSLSDASVERLRSDGFDARRLDLERSETFFAIADATDIVICPAPSDSGEEGYKRLYGAGIPRLCAWLAERRPLPRVVYTSSTSVHSGLAGDWLDESAPVELGRPKPAALAAAEAAVMAAPLSGTVLRLAGIYGAERNRLHALETGTLAAPAPTDIANIIHVDDAAAAAVFLLQRGNAGEAYLGVDCAPTPRSELYAWLSAETGLPAPVAGAPSPASHGGPKRCSNRKLLSLGFTFTHPSYRHGYRPLLAAFRHRTR